MAGPDLRPRRNQSALLPALIITVAAVATIAGLAVRPEEPVALRSADYLIVAGAPGLRWEDVDPEQTPHLWRLAEQGAIGSISLRSVHRPTCPVDGWLTLGAGNWAATSAARPKGPCPPLEVTVETPDRSGAFLPEQALWVRHNSRELPWGTVPGTLAGSVRCTVAVGEGAAVAAARSYGGVDWYVPTLPSGSGDASELLARCVLGIVDLGAVSGTGAGREVAVRQADAALGRVLAARPAESVLLVAGVADTGESPRLHVAVTEGPGIEPGWLTSASTSRAGYLQLVDIASTAVVALGRPTPEHGQLAGNPIRSTPGRPADLAVATSELVGADAEAENTAPVATWFLTMLTVGQLLLLLAMVPLLRRPDRVRNRLWQRAVSALLVAAALAIPVALATGAMPWWQFSFGGLVFAATTLALLVAAGALLVATPVFRSPLRLVGTCAALAAAAVAADLATGSQLQLNGVVGYSAQDGGRFAGIGAIGLGTLLAGTLLTAAVLAQQVARRWRPVVVVLVGAIGVVLVGSPYLGADPAGAMALTAGVCLTAAICTGGWFTLSRLAWALLAGAAVTATVALVDLCRPTEQRGGLGAFFTEIVDGTAGFAVQRVSLANTEALTASPLIVLAAGAGAFVWFALMRPWGGLHRLFGIHPALRAGMVGTAVSALLAGVLAGAALTIAGAAAAVTVPLATLAALQVRKQAGAGQGGAASGRFTQVLA